VRCVDPPDAGRAALRTRTGPTRSRCDCHDDELLDTRLRDQKAVERIAMVERKRADRRPLALGAHVATARRGGYSLVISRRIRRPSSRNWRKPCGSSGCISTDSPCPTRFAIPEGRAHAPRAVVIRG
jgi:hypothetical protein